MEWKPASKHPLLKHPTFSFLCQGTRGPFRFGCLWWNHAVFFLGGGAKRDVGSHRKNIWSILCHSIHVWHVYLHLPYKWTIHVGKYAVHPMDPAMFCHPGIRQVFGSSKKIVSKPFSLSSRNVENICFSPLHTPQTRKNPSSCVTHPTVGVFWRHEPKWKKTENRLRVA